MKPRHLEAIIDSLPYGPPAPGEPAAPAEPADPAAPNIERYWCYLFSNIGLVVAKRKNSKKRHHVKYFINIPAEPVGPGGPGGPARNQIDYLYIVLNNRTIEPSSVVITTSSSCKEL